MIALIEANQAWLETITHQMCNMPYSEQAKHLGGPIALLKMSCTRAAHEIADESVQIWGGRGLTKTGSTLSQSPFFPFLVSRDASAPETT